MQVKTLIGLRKKRKTSIAFWLAAFYLLAVLLIVALLPVLPLPYSASQLDLENPLQEPVFFSNASAKPHFLGTDHLGRDVLANLLFGFITGFLVALPVMLVAMAIGILVGSAAGFYGNRQLKISRASLVCFFLWFLAELYAVLFLWPNTSGNKTIFLIIGVMLGFILLFLLLDNMLKTVGFLHKKVPVPIDELVLKVMELLSSVPRLVLILALSALVSPGLGSVVLLLSLTYWAGPARLVRAEVLRIKQLPYIEAAKVSGLPNRRLIFRHILPNAAAPLWVAFSFGLSSLLGLEAALSFLGLGLPPEMPSWGHMLADARQHPEAWWLIFFPALALCITILAIQTLGNYFRETGFKKR